VRACDTGIRYATVAAGTGLLASASRLATQLPAAALPRAGLLAAVVWGQATVGVLTILYNVPVELGVLHQTGALTAWTLALWLMHGLRPLKAAAPIAGRAGAAAAAAACFLAVASGASDASDEGPTKATSADAIKALSK
jgi:hypothetical protein